MVVGNTTFTRDSTLYIEALLNSNVTDPLSGSRTGNENFVLTAYPKRTVRYPIITVFCDNITANRSGMRSEGMDMSLSFEIRIWARDVKERDDLTDSILTTLRSKQTDDTTGSIANNLFGLSFDSAVDINEEKIRSKVIGISYNIFIDN